MFFRVFGVGMAIANEGESSECQTKKIKTMTTNGNRERIISLIQSAQHQIQIAVSWLTDESIIQALTSVADGLNVELILSQDPLNAAFRYPNIRTLQKAGASVLKAGAQFPGEKGFMHAKFMVIDDKEVYGGSFNFTDAASYNYENFAMYDGREMTKLKSDFESWKEGAVDYTVGFENPEKINQLVRDQFEQNERIRKLMREQCKIGFDKSAKEERDSLIQQEIEKERLRRQARELAEGSKGISPKGSLIDGPKATVVKKHRHYGGTFMGDFGSRKRKNSHSIAQKHMSELQRRFPFVSCRIKDDTLVYISKDDNVPFNKDTFVDCNSGIHRMTINDFSAKYSRGELTFVGEVQDSHFQQILTGIHASPMVEESFKSDLKREI